MTIEYGFVFQTKGKYLEKISLSQINSSIVQLNTYTQIQISAQTNIVISTIITIL